MKVNLSLYHVVALSAVVSLSLVWVYWKVNKIERHLKDVNARVSNNASNITNIFTSLELMNQTSSVVPECVPVSGGDACTETGDEVEAEAEAEAHDEDSGGVVVDSGGDIDPVQVQEVLESIESEDGDDEPVEAVDDDEPIASSMEDDLVDDSSFKELLSPANWIFTEDELKKKTVEDLKQHLASKMQSTKGVKKDLVQRILDLAARAQVPM